MINLPEKGGTPAELKEQLASRDYESVRLGVYWPDDWKTLTLTKRQVLEILKGETMELHGDGYCYDALTYQDRWQFKGEILQIWWECLGDENEEEESEIAFDEGLGFEGTIFDIEYVEFN